MTFFSFRSTKNSPFVDFLASLRTSPPLLRNMFGARPLPYIVPHLFLQEEIHSGICLEHGGTPFEYLFQLSLMVPFNSPSCGNPLLFSQSSAFFFQCNRANRMLPKSLIISATPVRQPLLCCSHCSYLSLPAASTNGLFVVRAIRYFYPLSPT